MQLALNLDQFSRSYQIADASIPFGLFTFNKGTLAVMETLNGLHQEIFMESECLQGRNDKTKA